MMTEAQVHPFGLHNATTKIGVDQRLEFHHSGLERVLFGSLHWASVIRHSGNIAVQVW